MALDHELTLEELVTQSGTGDSKAFKMLFDMLHSRVYAYVRYRTNSHDESLDATQQIFIELWKALPRFNYRSDAAFYGFLFTITKRQIIGTYRQRHPSILALTSDDEFVGEEQDTLQEDEVMRALTSLDEITKEIVVLHHWSRYTFGEIAMMLTMTENAVRVRHHRGLLTLKSVLTEK